MNRRSLIIGGVAGILTVGTAGGLWLTLRDRGCGPPLTADDLDRAAALGVGYLLAAQRPGGDFVYEVDWRSGVESTADDPARQAGTAWGLGLANVDRPDPVVATALDRALSFWSGVRKTSTDGRVWFDHGGRKGATLGTVALVGLALVERLRAPGGLDDDTRILYNHLLDGILAFVGQCRIPAGGFRDRFDPETGESSGNGNPYADGEALLLFVKAGLYTGRDHLVDLAAGWCDADHERNVVGPRAVTPDPDQTKGYYQWGSMAWYELASAGRDPEKLGGWLLELADWMVNVHATLDRIRNTAYAYEGLLSAFAWARVQGDAEVCRSLACTANRGLGRLLAWQVGHPLAVTLTGADPKYLGGVQNEADDPKLRIDVTQHQTHAVILARRYGLIELVS